MASFEGSAGKVVQIDCQLSPFKLSWPLHNLRRIQQCRVSTSIFRRYRPGQSFFTTCCILHSFSLQLQKILIGKAYQVFWGGAMAIVTTTNISASDQQRYQDATESPGVLLLQKRN